MGFPLNIPESAKRQDWRIVAYDRNHNEIFNAGSIRAGKVTYQMVESDVDKVAVVELQGRRFEVVRFNNITSQPTTPH